MEELLDVNITEENTVFSLDVVNLFTNIPISDVLNILENNLENYFDDNNYW